MAAHGEPEDRREPPTEWITGWIRMQLRGHFIGALTSAFSSIACASVNAMAANKSPLTFPNPSDVHAAQ